MNAPSQEGPKTMFDSACRNLLGPASAPLLMTLPTPSLPRRRIDPTRETLELHPYARRLPPMWADEYARLHASIDAVGVREPIVLVDGRLADGLHRWLACQELGITCPAVEMGGEPGLALRLLTSNLARRELTPSQRALIVAREVLERGDRAPNGRRSRYSQPDAAADAGVSLTLVAHAIRLLRSGDADRIDAVWRGTLTLHAARTTPRIDPIALADGRPSGPQTRCLRPIAR